MNDITLVEIVQQAYPKLWHACHVEHRTRGQPHASGLTDRESGVLAHIGADGADAGPLAEHLGIAKSTLSAHITRLESLGLVRSEVAPDDQRRRRLRLTDAGRAALRSDSILDTQRVQALLDSIPESERAAAVQGLATLAAAASRLSASQRGPTP
jgi:DNA-binding MarR family transcriptional regulator